jgi:predicted acetyltransferase
MSQITVRPFEERDREAFFHVRAMTFNDGKPIPAEDQVFKTTRGYVGEVDGKVAGVFGILDFTCTRGEVAVKDAAVAGVAVLPEYRQSGVGAAMMTWGVRHFRDEGIPMASLYAFRESYYRRFGYEVCGSRLKITVPNGRYPRLQPELPVRTLERTDWQTLAPCYEKFAQARSGMNLRTEAHWGRVLGKDATVYAAGDPVEAYLLIDHKWQFWEGQAASEFAWCTRRGYESILGVLGSIGINKTSIEWYEPSDSPYLGRFIDQGVKPAIERLVMYRITDVKECFGALRPSGSGDFSFAVVDLIVPENAGPWKVRYSPAGVKIEPTDSADFELPIGLLTQAFLGEPSLADLRRNDLICCKNPAALEAAQNLLPPSPTYCTDFF